VTAVPLEERVRTLLLTPALNPGEADRAFDAFVEELRARGEQGAAEALALVEPDDPAPLQAVGVQLVARLGGAAVLRRLSEVAQDPARDMRVRHEAVQALRTGAWGDERRGAEALLARLAADADDPELREAALQALGEPAEVGGEEADRSETGAEVDPTERALDALLRGAGDDGEH